MAHTIGGIAATSRLATKVGTGGARYRGGIFRQKPTFPSTLLRVRAWLGFTAEPPADVPELPPDLVEPLIEPHSGIDGWTYQGTVLEERFPAAVEGELAPLAHAICAGIATPWTFERAARLLEGERAYGQAYAVIEAYLASGAVLDGALAKWRARLAGAVLAGSEG